jgi:hypothetical protein
MVEFGIRGYDYGYNKVSTGNFFAGMDIQYPYPLPNGYRHVVHPDLIYYPKF